MGRVQPVHAVTEAAPRRRATTRTAISILLVPLLAACGPPAADPVPPGSFAFAVYGDGPYNMEELGPYRRVLGDVSRSDVAFLIHVGDLFWYPCSDAVIAGSARTLDEVEHAVVYTPGDNEWTDCHGKRQGRHDPLERLRYLRTVFYRDPARSLGRRPIALASQAADSAFAEFAENARWARGGFVFATIHLVGSANGLEPFRGRAAMHDAAAERRTRAAISWLDEAFEAARAGQESGVVLAMHGNIGIDASQPRRGYDSFVKRLQHQVATFPGPVLLIHGDSHDQRVDHPLRAADGRVLENFTRLETFGSPEIGWVRVVVDTVAGRITRYEPRLMRGWW